PVENFGGQPARKPERQRQQEARERREDRQSQQALAEPQPPGSPPQHACIGRPEVVIEERKVVLHPRVFDAAPAPEFAIEGGGGTVIPLSVIEALEASGLAAGAVRGGCEAPGTAGGM